MSSVDALLSAYGSDPLPRSSFYNRHEVSFPLRGQVSRGSQLVLRSPGTTQAGEYATIAKEYQAEFGTFTVDDSEVFVLETELRAVLLRWKAFIADVQVIDIR